MKSPANKMNLLILAGRDMNIRSRYHIGLGTGFRYNQDSVPSYGEWRVIF